MASPIHPELGSTGWRYARTPARGGCRIARRPIGGVVERGGTVEITLACQR